MDRRMLKLILLFAAGWLFSCSGSALKEGRVQVTGMSVMVGNEPFAVISLQGPDGNTYRLQADSVSLAVFRLNQGREFQVAGTIKKEPMGAVLLVESFVKK